MKCANRICISNRLFALSCTHFHKGNPKFMISVSEAARSPGHKSDLAEDLFPWLTCVTHLEW